MPDVVVHITFPDGPPASVGAVRVVVEDVTTADAPAPRVGEERIPGPEPAHTVTVRLPEPDPHASYSVRVHVDVDGTGTIGEADFVSTQSHPVLTRGHGAEVTVPARRVSRG